MPVSYRFIPGLICGFLACLSFFIALLYTQLGIPTNSSKWTGEITKKKWALAEAAPAPRLLLIGGSGTTFGLNAQRIQEQTGWRTFNLGRQLGLGLDCLFYSTKKVARPGDTVLLILEYQLYTTPKGSDAHDDYILARDPEFFYQMSLLDKIDMATRIPFKRIQKGWEVRRKPEEPPYPRPPYTDDDSQINEYGDELSNAEALRAKKVPYMDMLITPLVEGIPFYCISSFSQIRDFLKWARDHHVRVLATYPNSYYRQEYDGINGRKALKTIQDFYRSEGVPLIGEPRDVMLPRDDFFDGYYHLTHEAAIRRTDRLIPLLEPYLNSSK